MSKLFEDFNKVSLNEWREKINQDLKLSPNLDFSTSGHLIEFQYLVHILDNLLVSRMQLLYKISLAKLLTIEFCNL